MTRNAKVSYDYLTYIVDDKIQTGKKVILGLNDNPTVFVPPLDISSTALGVTNGNLIGAHDIFKATPTHTNLTNQNNMEKAWNHDFKIAGANINRLSNGDEHIINLGGLTSVTTETTPWVRPTILLNLKAVSYDVLGGLHFSSDYQLHVEGYVYIVGTGAFNIVNDQMIMDPGAVLYSFKSDTHNKTDMIGLPRRKDMFVWAYGYNKAGCGPISLPIPIYLT